MDHNFYATSDVVYITLGIALPMIGIPPSGTPASDVFWASFWPALYSGFLYSILTGLTVGIAVLIVQRYAERQLAKRGYMRECSLMQQQLRHSVACPNPFVISNAVASVPRPVEGAIQVLRTCPISLWRHELPEQKFLLDHVHALQASHSAFQSAASTLDHLISQFARSHNAARGAIAANDARLHAFVFGRLCGFERTCLLPWIDVSVDALGWLDPAFVEAAADPTIGSAYRAYAESRKKLEEHLAAVVGALDA